jgi:hypothetical protein
MRVSPFSFLIISLLTLTGCAGVKVKEMNVVSEVKEPTVEPRIINPDPVPSDAIVLFDGKDLAKWEGQNRGEAKWVVKDGAVIVNGTGDIQTKESFGDCQLHIEWATPSEVKGQGQGRGNSGIFLQDRYELQVLDSYGNKTYFHGQAGALYKQHPPLVNASRKPGEWQTYDIIFHAPRFNEDKSVKQPASMTVLHNGVLVQDNAVLVGKTVNRNNTEYEAHPAKQPLRLQDHGNPVRFRNIWIRPL